jgi:UDP-sugar transporter A1/2/3
LGLGVAVVQLSEHHIHVQSKEAAEQNQWLGLIAVLVSCITSGFAGVYFEFVLKTTNESVHCRNFQLAFWSFLFAIVQIVLLSNDISQVKSHGLFHGFDKIVVLVVIMQALTGFVVSMMLKYADALLKGFAISGAVIVATVASFFLFDTKVNPMFFAGASMVVIAVKMYSYYAPGNEKVAAEGQTTFFISKASFTNKRLLFAGLVFASAVAWQTRTISE